VGVVPGTGAQPCDLSVRDRLALARETYPGVFVERQRPEPVRSNGTGRATMTERNVAGWVGKIKAREGVPREP